MRYSVRFEWDPDKERTNRSKHRLSFEEAATVFDDLLSVTIEDRLHSHEEERLTTIGLTECGRLVVTTHTEHDDVIRIISARRATPWERRIYEHGE